MATLSQFDPPPRKSKQQASKSITEQSRKRPLPSDDASQSVSVFPASVYGQQEPRAEAFLPEIVYARDTITNGLLSTVSQMYFDTTDPFAEILRCMDDRIDPSTHRYVSGLETTMKNEVFEQPASKGKQAKEKIIITPLDMIACPFRRPEVVDQWAPYDVTLLELGVCEMKGFNAKKIAPLFEGRKSIQEIVAFFDLVYSKTDHWRKIQKLINHEALSEGEDDSIKSEPEEVTRSPVDAEKP